MSAKRARGHAVAAAALSRSVSRPGSQEPRCDDNTFGAVLLECGDRLGQLSVPRMSAKQIRTPDQLVPPRRVDANSAVAALARASDEPTAARATPTDGSSGRAPLREFARVLPRSAEHRDPVRLLGTRSTGGGVSRQRPRVRADLPGRGRHCPAASEQQRRECGRRVQLRPGPDRWTAH